jgi:molybdopterin-guanine dinucleotide biosynthesis protein A
LSEAIDDVGAAILAGGLSRRMGDNKALLRLEEGGSTIIEVAVARLAEAGLPPPTVITNSPKDYSFLGLECVPDDIKGAGALGGLLTALSHTQHERVLVVACDMPELNVGLLRYMLAEQGEYDAIVPKWHDGGQVRVEPLHAIYSTTCLETIRKQIERGELKMGNFLEEINVRYLAEDEMRLYDPELRSFVNVNTPQEWLQVKKRGGGDEP